MAKPTIVTRASKGSALTWTEGDANLTNLQDATFSLVAGSGGTTVTSDLNGTVTVIAGTNITLSGDNATKTLTINAAGGSGIANVSEDTTPELGGNLEVANYSLLSDTGDGIRLGNASIFLNKAATTTGSAYLVTDQTNLQIGVDIQGNYAGGARLQLSKGTNGGVSIVPAGTGKLIVSGLSYPNADGTNGQVLSTNGTGTLSWTTVSSGGITDVVNDTTPQLGGDLDVNGKNIVSTANANINIVPNGTGDVYLTADTVAVGDLNTAATLTTYGTGNLTLNTNGGTSSGSLSIVTGAGGAVTLDSQGNTFLQTTASSTSYLNYIYRTDSALNNAPVAVFRKKRTDGLLSALNGVTVPFSAQLVGSDNTAVQFARQLNTYSTTSNAHTIQWQVSSDSFSTNVQLASLESNLIALGETSGTTAQTVTTPRAANLVLNTNRGTNSGNITITAGANGAISITPNGTGKTVISAMNYNEGALYDLGTTGGTIAPNVTNGNVQKVTLNAALTINAFTSPVAGQSLTLIIYGGTAYTSITSTMKFAGGIKTLTATAGCIDILSVYYDGTNYFASLGKGFA